MTFLIFYFEISNKILNLQLEFNKQLIYFFTHSYDVH